MEAAKSGYVNRKFNEGFSDSKDEGDDYFSKDGKRSRKNLYEKSISQASEENTSREKLNASELFPSQQKKQYQRS